MLQLDPNNKYILLSERPAKEFGTETPKTDKNGQPLTEFMVLVATTQEGFTPPQIKVVAPAGKPLAPLSPVALKGGTARLYKMGEQKGDAYRSVSFTASAVEAV